MYLKLSFFWPKFDFEVVYNLSFQTVIENLNGGELSREQGRSLKQQRPPEKSYCCQYSCGGTTKRGAKESSLALKPVDSSFNSGVSDLTCNLGN